MRVGTISQAITDPNYLLRDTIKYMEDTLLLKIELTEQECKSKVPNASNAQNLDVLTDFDLYTIRGHTVPKVHHISGLPSPPAKHHFTKSSIALICNQL